jgi:hypothetical protein
VFAADVVYPGNAEHWSALLQTLAWLAAPPAVVATSDAAGSGAGSRGTVGRVAGGVAPPAALVLVALTSRGGGAVMAESFLALAREAHGFEVAQVPTAALKGTRALELGDGTALYRFTLREHKRLPD